MNINKQILLTILNIFLIIIGILILFFALLSGYFSYHALFNGDTLQVPLGVIGVLDKGRNIGDFFHSGSPYYFPDYFIFAFAFFMLPEIQTQVVASGVLQVVVTISAIGYLAYSIAGKKFLPFIVTIFSIFIWMALIPVDGFYHKIWSHIFSHAFILAFHYGSFISLLLFLVFWTAYWRQTKKLPKCILLFIIFSTSFLSGLSDSLFPLQTSISFCLTVIIFDLYIREFSWRKIALLFINICFSLLGMKVFQWIHPHAQNSQLVWDLSVILYSHLPNRWDFFCSMVFDIMRDAPFYAVLLIMYLFIVARAYYVLLSRRKLLNTEKTLFLITFFPIISVILTSSINLTIAPVDIADRYTMPLFFFPLIIPVLYFGYYYPRWVTRLGMIISITIFATLGYNVFSYIKKNEVYAPIYQPFSCIDDALKGTDAKTGFANFWTAKPYQLFSHYDLEIANYEVSSRDIDPRRWVTFGHYYRDQYDFAIVPPSNDPNSALSRIIEINGQPKKIAHCGGDVVVIYEKDRLKLE